MWTRPCDPATLASRHVLVIGLGRTGASLARYLTGRGARVRLCDRRADAPLPALASAAVEIVRGADGPELLDGIDLVVPSPGVPADAPLLVAARQAGIPVRSEIEVAAAAITAPLIAITGTNGKSTTTSLIGAMLEEAGRKVFTGGNLGTPLIDAAGGSHDVVVAEISSFQLEWVERFHPQIGVLLNVTDDHLDRYRDRAHYLATKARLFARQGDGDVAVLNRDDAAVAVAGRDAACRGAHVRQRARARAAAGRASARSSRATRSCCASARASSGSRSRARRCTASTTARTSWRRCSRRARSASPAGALQATIDGFRGLRHRLETVREVAGVAYVDDSKGTNVGALLKSLEGYRDGSVVLIAGGLAKGGDYGVARDLLSRKVRHLILYGDARAFLDESWRGATETTIHERFADAVEGAIASARPGDVVLLSPACASMDQFRDYAARGDAFAAMVEAIPNDAVARC